jgi:hypothetical protein
VQDRHDPDFPETLMEHEKSITEFIDRLGKKYGLSFLKDQIFSYADKMDLIAQLNRDLAECSPEKNEKEYAEIVQRIILTTQDYYTFIGNLPEDVRDFFLTIINAANNGQQLDEISKLLGQDLMLQSVPMLSHQSIRPKNYIMQIDAITNHLASLNDQTQLKVGKRGNQPVLTTVTLDMPDHMKIEGGSTLSTYDKSIINGVTSLLESGNTVFSIPMLYHSMTGKQNPTVDDQLYEELSGKLEKMRRMMLSIDLTEENEARYITKENGETMEISDLTLEGYLLPLNRVSGIINGKRAELYQILQNPPLYTYSKMRRQLASVRLNLLNAPVNNNSTTIPLKTYLLQRIEMMKNEKNNIKRTNILYKSVYQELGVLDANKTKKMRIRNYTSTILNYYVEQSYILSFEEYKEGRIVAGVQIYL